MFFTKRKRKHFKSSLHSLINGISYEKERQLDMKNTFQVGRLQCNSIQQYEPWGYRQPGEMDRQVLLQCLRMGKKQGMSYINATHIQAEKWNMHWKNRSSFPLWDKLSPFPVVKKNKSPVMFHAISFTWWGTTPKALEERGKTYWKFQNLNQEFSTWCVLSIISILNVFSNESETLNHWRRLYSRN